MCRGKNVVVSFALVALVVVGVFRDAGAAQPNSPLNSQPNSQPNSDDSAAGESSVALVWNRSPEAASCIGQAALTRAVEQRVGRSVFAPAGGASLSIEGIAERDQARGAWRATLTLSLADGQLLGRRELSTSAPGCGPLGEMVVLAMALMIRDREAFAAPAARAPIPRPPKNETPSTTPSVVASADPEGPRRAWEATSDVTATLSGGLFPNPATGVRLRGALRSPRAPVFELELAAAFPSEARFRQQAGGRFFGTWLGAAVCPLEWSAQPWRLRVCGGGSIGVLFFRPFGTNAPGLRRRPLLVARASAGLERAIGRSWFAAMGAELFAPAFRERFEIDAPTGETHTLFAMTPIGVSGAFGFGRRF